MGESQKEFLVFLHPMFGDIGRKMQSTCYVILIDFGTLTLLGWSFFINYSLLEYLSSQHFKLKKKKETET